MSVNTAIEVLLLYPLLQVLSFNWVRFRWGFRRGVAPLSPEIEARAKAVDRGLAIASQVLLLIGVVYFFRSSSISIADVGLTGNNWRAALTYGLLLGIFPMAFGALVQAKMWSDRGPTDPPMMRLGRLLLNSFSSEIWRAFCIVALTRLEVAAWAAVVITAAVASVLKLSKTVAFAAGGLFFGLLTGFLFVKTRSLIAPLALIFISTARSELFAYRARSQARAGLPPLKCPKCAGSIDRNSGSADRRYVCPACGERMRLLLKPWQAQTLNFACFVVSASILIALRPGILWGFIVFLPIYLALFIFSIAAATNLFPGLLSLQAERNPYQPTLFRSK